jgi:hypothetical protein
MALVAHHRRPGSRSGRLTSTRSRVLVVVATLGSLAASLLGPASATAAYELTLAPGYTSSAITCHQMGQSDQNGVLYTTCGARIYRYDRFGARLADIVLPAGVAQPRDVAPSPDGTYLYISQGYGTPRRLNRQANGTYTLDAAWRLGQFSFWNQPFTPVGHALATDGRGDIYISNGSLWTTENTQTSIAKFRPDGTAITAFGDYGKEDGNWITNQDIAVSRDGRRVFVGENCGRACRWGDPLYSGSRVTRYDFTAGGTYRFTRIVSAQGPMDGNPFPRCTSAGATHSAYALALDVKERLYVTSTTCGRIQMWETFDDPARDRFLRSVAVNVDPNLNGEQVGRRNHYLAVDWAGRLYAQEWNLKIVPTDVSVPNLPLPALAPLPEPDVQAPTLVSLTMPPTTTTQDVEAAIAATDDYGVAELQLAREDGNWGPWQPFSALVSYTLSNGYGIKGVYVRVRDMAGNESNAVYRTVSFVEPIGDDEEPPPPVADAADPVLAAIAVPALTATRTVRVGIDATDDTGVRAVRLANEDGNWAAWQPFAAVVDWQLSAGEGAKVVYVQVRDGAGRESGTLTARTRVAADAPPPPPPGGGGGGQPDTVAPLLESLTLPAETTTQALDAVTAATDAVGVAQVRFANEDGNWTAWQAWKQSVRWTLTAGFGGKLVYAQVRDAVGNESAVVTARTSYVRTAAGPVDGADPALVAVVLPETTRTPNVAVRLTATDDVAVTQVRFANEDGVWRDWQPYGAEVPHVLTAGNTYKVVYAQVRDAVGRESNVLFARTLVAP